MEIKCISYSIEMIKNILKVFLLKYYVTNIFNDLIY